MASSPSAPASAVKAAALPVSQPPSSAAVAVAQRAPAVLRVASGSSRRGAALVAAAALDDLRPAIDEYPEGILSGEWTENFSLLSYADLRAYLESQITTAGEMSPTAKLGDVMSRPVQVATPGQRLAEVDAFFAGQQYSGLPVVDEEGRCVGVVSKKDKAKAPNGNCSSVMSKKNTGSLISERERARERHRKKFHELGAHFLIPAKVQMESTVGEVMSSPAITLTLTPEKTVLEAAALMLKEKVHRIPVVNQQQQVIGIVTRTDVFQALDASNRA